MKFNFETFGFIFGTKTGLEVCGLESLRLRPEGKWDETFPEFFRKISGTRKLGSGMQSLTQVPIP